jgi:predicted TIM-barrel fold metal-dependent hydrolase
MSYENNVYRICRIIDFDNYFMYGRHEDSFDYIIEKCDIGIITANVIEDISTYHIRLHVPKSIITYKQWLTNNNIKIVIHLILYLRKIFKVPRPIFEIIMTHAGMSWCTEWYRKEFRNVYYEEYIEHVKQYAKNNGYMCDY